MRKYVLKFENGTDIPIISMKLSNGKKIHALLDTGSEQTVFDTSVVDNNKDCFTEHTVQHSLNVTGISSTKSFQTVIVATELETEEGTKKLLFDGIKMPLGHVTSHFKAIINDCNIAVLIGSNIMSIYNVKIDYTSKTVTFKL